MKRCSQKSPASVIEGIFFCPEGAACVAALRRLLESGWIKTDEEVVIFNTASGLKYLDVIQETSLKLSSAIAAESS